LAQLDDIVAELERTLGPLEGEPVALDGGITNRNYRALFGAGAYVIRVHGKDTELLGIDRESEHLATRAAARLGVAPELVYAGERCMVTRYVECAAMSEADVAADVERVARALRSFHDSGVRLPRRFHVPQLLERYAQLTHDRGGTLPADYAHAQRAAERIAQALGDAPEQPCHNDLLPGNIIRAREGARVMIVDWEYAGMGDARFDLGNLAVNNDFDEDREELLLRSYLGRAPRERERASLSLMRVASDAREGAWGVLQGALSDLDFDFAGYAREHFERMRAAVQQPSFEDTLSRATRGASAAR